MQIIIQCKGQVRFSTAKINDIHGSLFRKCRQNILHKFQITVNLPEFIISGMNNFSFPGLYSQIYQKGNRLIFLQYILLLPVVRQIRAKLTLLRSVPAPLYGNLSLFTHQRPKLFLRALRFQLPKLQFHTG